MASGKDSEVGGVSIEPWPYKRRMLSLFVQVVVVVRPSVTRRTRACIRMSDVEGTAKGWMPWSQGEERAKGEAGDETRNGCSDFN